MTILWLGDAACHDRDRVGGKAAYLSRLTADAPTEHPVPPGFCLTVAGGADPADATAAYAALAARCGTAPLAVAVRSSALDEDGACTSFAGQHETYLNVIGAEAVAEAAARCRASARAPRALAYRAGQGLGAAVDDAGVVVLVQQLIVADVSAVVFSANPVTVDREEIVVTASWGLGESVVGGTVTPDTYHLRKADLAVTARRIAEKGRMTVAVPGGVREVGVPRLLATQPALADAQITELGRLALRLEGHFGWPVDVECAYAGGQLYLLQCRPITTLHAAPAARPQAPHRGTPARVPGARVRPDNGATVEQGALPMAITEATPLESRQPPAGPIPAPPDFPVAWERPGDEQICWTFDRMHFPNPIPPLVAAFLEASIGDGFTAAFAHYGVPLRGAARRINTYHYESYVPLQLPPEELAALGQRSQEKIGAALGRLGEAWRDEWLPAIRERLAAWERFDLGGATLPALRGHLDETLSRHRELWQIHFRITVPTLLSMSLFQELYRDLFGDDDPFDAHRLLQGLGNETVRANRELWLLSRRALAVPAVRRVFEERPAAEVAGALAGSTEGLAFLAALCAYLDEHGRRGNDFLDLDRPYWIEDPTPVIDSLKGYVANAAYDLEAQEAGLVAERGRLVTAARERLQGYPQQVRGQFEHLLKAAQAGALLSEDHGYYLDYQGGYRVRMVLLECGRRLAAAGSIADRDDVFLLTFAEVRDALAAPAGADRRGQVAERAAEMAHFRAIAPPPVLGTPPPGPPPDDPMARAIARFFGGPPPATQEPGSVRGNAGSPGKATGRAVVVRSLAEAGRLRRGDILVAETTAPPWTPLFATAAAIVTDTGGILSHSAVVAREYRIPAVVGAGAATRLIRDGQRVEVDGDAGLVRLLDAGD